MSMGFVARNSIIINRDGKEYEPNTPLSLGAGFAIRNTIFNFRFRLPVFTPNEDKYGETEALDIQIHHFGKQFLYDVFFQRYEGFYLDDREIEIIPDMMVQQIGFEITYLFNGKKFSSKAAFEQNELQLRSAGSLALGGGIYYYDMDLGTDSLTGKQPDFNNLILGINLGYAYTWVLNSHWLMTGIASVGAGFGNETDELGDGNIKVLPITFARGAIGYHRSGWGIDFSFLIHSKKLHYSEGSLDLTGTNFQIAFIKHINRLF